MLTTQRQCRNERRIAKNLNALLLYHYNNINQEHIASVHLERLYFAAAVCEKQKCNTI